MSKLKKKILLSTVEHQHIYKSTTLFMIVGK